MKIYAVLRTYHIEAKNEEEAENIIRNYEAGNKNRLNPINQWLEVIEVND